MNILESTGGRTQLLAVVRERQNYFFGHVLKADGLENLAMT